jgi:predicted RNA-binding protein
MSESSPRYWIVVSSPDNWQRTADRGFTVQGLKSRHRKKAELMHPGDKIVSYVTGAKAFAGVLTITSDYYEEHDNPIWVSGNKKRADEDYPFRVRVEKDVWLPEGELVDAEPLARQMEYARRYPAANWTLAFQGNVHPISESDYALIRAAIDEAAAVSPTAS